MNIVVIVGRVAECQIIYTEKTLKYIQVFSPCICFYPHQNYPIFPHLATFLHGYIRRIRDILQLWLLMNNICMVATCAQLSDPLMARFKCREAGSGNVYFLLRNVFTRVISYLPGSSYQGHLIDVESDPGKVAEENEKSCRPSEASTLIAKM